MRLKKIVLVGFKSFAEKTTLHFDAGITCIVGPNGCGKSNIADAFRWVLGEQSAKSLRGHKMPDVIFAGASQRKPLNFAEVSLTLEDIQGALPIDYEEITITRRLHRSGESEYFINSNPVRLKDIHSLLFDSGIGRNAFSIFEQGKLDQVINYSPLERRFIFEEAAGIVRFLHRKQEAFKRLEQADLNLSRVNDIHLEVEKNISVLKDQAEKALVYKDNQMQLEMLDKTYFLMRWQNCEKKQNDTEIQLSLFEKQLGESQQLISSKHHQLMETRQLAQLNEKRWKEKNEELYQLRSLAEIQKREYESNQQRIQEALQKINKLKRELEDLHLARQMRQETLKEMQNRRMKVAADLEEVESKLNLQGSKVRQKEKEVVKLRQEQQSRQQEHFKCMQRESALASEVKQLELRIENNVERLENLDRKIKQVAEESERFVQLIQEKKILLQQVSALVDSHKDRLDQYESDLQILSRRIEEQRNEYEIIRKKGLEQQARYSVLLKMRADLEGFSAGSKRLMQESKLDQSPLYGLLSPLYEFFKPEPEAAEALSAALRLYAQTLVVETEEHLKQVLQFAEKYELHDFSLVCLEHIRNVHLSESHNSFGGLLSKVEQNPIACHFLKSIEIWETAAKAVEALIHSFGKIEGWASGGGYIDQRGVFFKIKSSENQVFLRESELVGLEEEIGRHETLLFSMEKQMQQLQQNRAHLQAERLEIDKQLRRDEMKLVEVNFGWQKAMGDQEKCQLQQTAFEKEQEEIREFITRQKADLKEKERLHFALKQEFIQMEEQISSFERELANQEQALRIQLQDEKEKGLAYQQILEDKHRLDHQWLMLESKEQNHENQVHRITDDCHELDQHQNMFKESNAQLQVSMEASASQLEEMGSQCKECENEGAKFKEKLEQIEKEGYALQTSSKQIEMQIAQLQGQYENHILMAKGLEADLQEKYCQTMEEIANLKLPMERSLEQIEKQMRTLKATLHEAGDVNLTAIEELEKHQVRYQFLTQQMKDLSDTKSELVQLIAQLDAESRRLLRETFEMVRRNFQKNFGILFNGGEADLQFTGVTENILEAGIEITAKPPGKQMRSISLLSGGEKCLTAVALLFAIFEVKPAPFCILDEIDAPLDDTNVDRFVNVVKHFVDRCQFLIITHNKRTMAISDVLFGVSMEEKGVSKLLSLEFSHDSLPEVATV